MITTFLIPTVVLHRHPLFVLPMGIFPMCKEPLRVFEPRYKQMLDDCVLNNSQFGYIAADINGEDENGLDSSC